MWLVFLVKSKLHFSTLQSKSVGFMNPDTKSKYLFSQLALDERLQKLLSN